MVARDDRELSSWRVRRLDRHLSGCAACRTDAEATTRLFAALAVLPTEAVVSGRLAQDTFRAVRVLAADEAERRASHGWRQWLQTLVPLVASAAVVAVVLQRSLPEDGTSVANDGLRRPPSQVATTEPRGRSTGTADPLAPEDVPEALLRAPDFFATFGVIRDFEKLKHLEMLRTVTRGEVRSDG